MIRRAVLSALLSSAICYSAWAATPRFIPGTATDLPQLVTKEGKIYKLGKKPYPAGTRAKWIAEGRTLAKTPDGYLPKGQKLKGAADNRSYLPPIGDQGSLGSCVFWAGTYYTKTANMKWKDPSINVNVASNQCSPRFTYNLCNAGADNGGYGHEPFEICMRYGVASLQQLPYTTDYTTLPSQADFLEGLHRRTTNYVWLWDFSPDASQIAELKAWLDAGHVAACGVYAEDTFDAWGPGDAPWVGTTCTRSDTGTSAPPASLPRARTFICSRVSMLPRRSAGSVRRTGISYLLSPPCTGVTFSPPRPRRTTSTMSAWATPSWAALAWLTRSTSLGASSSTVSSTPTMSGVASKAARSLPATATWPA